MIKTINHKTYNTETALKIGSWSSIDEKESLYYSNLDLYKKKSKHFRGKNLYFLCGIFEGKENYFKVLNKQEAQKWCEDHNIDQFTIMVRFKTEDLDKFFNLKKKVKII